MPEKQYFTGIDVINAPKIESLTVTEDGTYTASSGVIGYNPVVVNTNQPWQPLEDGYSNFWFELTDDTLSPWLNFSAKTENAVIDWGDGSGEVALDTLTPTHTYSKVGRYVVKVKGVTGIDRISNVPYTDYIYALTNVELNSEVTSLAASAFKFYTILQNVDVRNCNFSSVGSGVFFGCTSLKNIYGYNDTITGNMFYLCPSLTTFTINAGTGRIETGAFYYCAGLKNIIIPSGVNFIGQNAFRGCESLYEIHVQATTPSVIYDASFSLIMPNYIIYVPVGYGDTYKSASGWSTYADHILEEGQTPNRMMLAKFNTNNAYNEEMR